MGKRYETLIKTKAGAALVTSDKADFRSKRITRLERHRIMIKGLNK